MKKDTITSVRVQIVIFLATYLCSILSFLQTHYNKRRPFQLAAELSQSAFFFGILNNSLATLKYTHGGYQRYSQ
jgi:hypothetical protein